MALVWIYDWGEQVEVRDCKKITNHFRGICRIYPILIKENRMMSTCNRLDLKNTRTSTDYAQKSLRSLFWMCYHLVLFVRFVS